MKRQCVSQPLMTISLVLSCFMPFANSGDRQACAQHLASQDVRAFDDGYRLAAVAKRSAERDPGGRLLRYTHEVPRESAEPSAQFARRPCGWECDFCWIGTPWEDNCDAEWENDGQCDCGCQFDDTADCISPALPDLVVEDSFVDTESEVLPGVPVGLSDTVTNVGAGLASTA
ncbi:MAG: hypothetical protein PVI86_16565, partial [Phycisphaerae bacterium]